MARIAGTCYFKIDGQQLSMTGGIEVPMNTKVNDDVIGLDGSVDRKETHRAPYIKGTFKVPKDFPVNKVTTSDQIWTGRNPHRRSVANLTCLSIMRLQEYALRHLPEVRHRGFLMMWDTVALAEIVNPSVMFSVTRQSGFSTP